MPKAISHNKMFLSLSRADMTFLHEGNETLIDGLVNFEKMVSEATPTN